MPRLTANLRTDAQLEQAKILAVKQKKSLAQWAGDAIISHMKQPQSTQPRR